MDRGLAQYNLSLLVNAEIWECGAASAGGKGQDIVIMKVVIGPSHDRGGVVGSKNRTDVDAM